MSTAIFLGLRCSMILVGLALLNTLVSATTERQSLLPLSSVSLNEEQIALGKQIYRQGFSSANHPVTAIVQGDVTFDGSQFTCINCHRRSGMGAIEGNRIVPPVTGLALYNSSDWFWTDIENLATRDTLTASPANPFSLSSGLAYRKRPAYTDNTLAQAIREGIDSNGQPFSPLMPRYNLAEQDMSALIAYLKTLSTQFSPGVTEKNIYFATVVTEEVNLDQRQAMLTVLETYFKEKNAQTRDETRRLQTGAFYHRYKNKAYRQWVLLPWLLTGPPTTWPEQLARYYQQQPVFAMVSGISTHYWQPIYTFCEQRQIPCLLPNTDWPKLPDKPDDFYTLYFSKGVSLEALAIAKQLARHSTPTMILQIFRPDTVGAAAAQMVHRTLSTAAIRDWSLTATTKLTVNSLSHQVQTSPTNIVIFWLSGDELVELTDWSTRRENSPQFYFSATLLNSQFTLIPQSMRDKSFVAHLYSLPTDLKPRSQRIQAWLQNRNISLINLKIQDQTYFASLILGEGIMHIKRYFYRDYLLDSIDHAEGMAIFSAYYPRLSFGPGQRYLAKGCYILELKNQNDEVIVNNSTWIVP
ncbi:MAG: c-type cytochrome [Thioploca sp.]|nr:c-type cytochrome [Thioploca sp.]